MLYAKSWQKRFQVIAYSIAFWTLASSKNSKWLYRRVLALILKYRGVKLVHLTDSTLGGNTSLEYLGYDLKEDSLINQPNQLEPKC